MRSLFIPVRLVTNARNLVFEYNLDRNIDQVSWGLYITYVHELSDAIIVKVARRAAYEAMGENSADIVTHMEKTPEVEGIVVGDEIRLRQIVTNLAR
jgi:osomolarity two-component system sensor histidine kinase SLN1